MGYGGNVADAEHVESGGLQLKEKQRARVFYGLLERQFRSYYDESLRRTGVTGELLVRALESRLDNIVYRLGFADSRKQARQLVRHGHITVDGRKITIPSFQIREGQSIVVKEGSKKNDFIRAAVESARGRGIPDWLELNAELYSGKVLALPKREDIKLPIQEQLIVELYSR